MYSPICEVKSVTQLIHDQLHRKRWNATILAEKVQPPTTPQNMYKKLSKDSIEVEWLVRISNAMEHDFFQDLSREYQEEAKRKNFKVENVVEEPDAVYMIDGKLATAMRKIAQEEIKKEKK